MTRIANVDQLVLILQQKLLERSGVTRGAGRERRRAGDDKRRSHLEQVYAVAAIEDVDDRLVRRALVQNILAETFGDPLVNDAQFQQLTEQVTTAMESDAGASRLLARLVSELRASAR